MRSLGTRQVGKTLHEIIDAGTINDQTNHVMHADPSAAYNVEFPGNDFRASYVLIFEMSHYLREHVLHLRIRSPQ